MNKQDLSTKLRKLGFTHNVDQKFSLDKDKHRYIVSFTQDDLRFNTATLCIFYKLWNRLVYTAPCSYEATIQRIYHALEDYKHE